jgi:hypothetical protein
MGPCTVTVLESQTDGEADIESNRRVKNSEPLKPNELTL